MSQPTNQLTEQTQLFKSTNQTNCKQKENNKKQKTKATHTQTHNTHAHMHTHAQNMHTHTHTYTHMHTHAHTYTHIHTPTNQLLLAAGEIWRLRQLELQLPPHDVDKRRCSGLSPRDFAAFDAFNADKVGPHRV